MKDHIEVVPIFPTPVYFAINQNNISSCIEYLEKDPIQLEKSKETIDEYGTISVDTHILNRPELESLRNWILDHVNNYCKEVLAWDYGNIHLTQSWVSIKSKNEKHTFHKHPNSLISGVFYWSDETIEDISFLRPARQTNFEINRDTSKPAPYAFDHHNFTPLKNTLILFPSELQHGVPKNNSNTPRKSLAFNTFIFEKLGSVFNLTELDLTKIK